MFPFSVLGVILLTVFRYYLGVSLILASLGKIGEPTAFTATIISYQVIPSFLVRLAKPLAIFFIGSETGIALLFLLGFQSRAAGALSSFLMITFIIAVSVNLLRGRTNLDCGCYGSAHHRRISSRLVASDMILLVMSICIMIWGGGFFAFDNIPINQRQFWSIEIIVPILLIIGGLLSFYLLLNRIRTILLLNPLEH